MAWIAGTSPLDDTIKDQITYWDGESARILESLKTLRDGERQFIRRQYSAMRRLVDTLTTLQWHRGQERG